MLNRAIVLIIVGVMWLTACGANTPAAAPIRAPILPSPDSAKPTLPPVGSKITPAAATPTSKPAEPAPTPDQPVSSTTAELFSDDFSDPNSGWDIGSSDDGSVGYEKGEYFIHVKTTKYSLWANPSKEFGDVAVAVDAYRVDGPIENEMGVICRYRDVRNFVYATISSDGYYGIIKRSAGEPTILTGDGKLIQSDAINQGDTINRFELICAGDQFTLVVNGQPIDQVTITGFERGDVGLLGGTYDTGDVTVHFDNFVVTPPTDIGPITPSTASVTTLYEDDFSDSQSGWDSAQSDNGYTDYGKGDYVIRVDKEKWQLWANPTQSFDDVWIEVEAQATAGPNDNEMGVICRYQDGDNFMYGSISSDGYYAIFEIKDGQSTLLTGDGKLQSSDLIKQGEEVNRVQFVCNGDEYTLGVNGKKLDSVTNSGFTSGDVGLLAGTYDVGGVEIHFDNFSVTTP